jgi:SAM-dependent methyltransferase
MTMAERAPITPAELALLDMGLLHGCTRLAPGLYQGPGRARRANLAAFRDSEGVGLNERAKLEFSTAHFETPLYECAVAKALEAMPAGPVLELGAGDGRITRMLLSRWTGPVLACDCNLPALQRLRAGLPEAERNRLVILCEGIEDLPLPPATLAGVVAIEVLYYLGAGFEAALARLAAALVPGGRMVHAEPTLEGWLLYCLAVDDWDGALAAACQGKVERAYRGFTPEEMRTLYAGCGLALLETSRTPLMNILLVNRLLRSSLPEIRRQELLRTIRSAAGICQTPRCVIYTAGRAGKEQQA